MDDNKNNIYIAAHSPEIVSELARVHIKRYSKQCYLAKTDKSYRFSESLALLSAWNEIKDKDCVFANVSHDAQNEILDALYDEGYEYPESDEPAPF